MDRAEPLNGLRYKLGVDIDGVQRDFLGQVSVLMERDHPEKWAKVSDRWCETWDTVFEGFDSKSEAYKWIYDERVFEIFALAQRTYPKVIEHLNAVQKVLAKHDTDVVIWSVQSKKAIPATLHWLAKWGCTIPSYQFFQSMTEKIDWALDNLDYIVEDSPTVLETWANEVHPSLCCAPRYAYNTNVIDKYSIPTLDFEGDNPKGLGEVPAILGIYSNFEIIEEPEGVTSGK